MKKIICVILCLLIAVSAAVPIAAESVDNNEDHQDKYILGDSNLDEKVTIIDANLIQYHLNAKSELSGLQLELSDIDKNGLNIMDVTYIQQYLASSLSKYRVGESAADENEGVVYTQGIQLRNCLNGQIISSPFKVYFSTAYPDVPFLDHESVIALFMSFYGYDVADIDEKHISEFVDKYIVAGGPSVTFDYNEKEMIFSDYTTFLTTKTGTSLNPFGATFPNNDVLYKADSMDRYYGGDPCSVSFTYDTLPMLKYRDKKILIPLQTFSDFFLSNLDAFIQYNGNELFVLTSSTAKSPDKLDYWNMYINVPSRETVTDALAQVNYYELCTVLEARYGLKEAHDITDFDAYFSRKGFKKELLSGNVERMEIAHNDIATLLFEDFHSSANSFSPYLDKSISIETDMSPVFLNTAARFKEVAKTRDAVIGTPSRYERRGDTVFITFDSFGIENIGNYYTEGHISGPDGDTIELLSYALNRLENEDKDAKNVVVDLSCNTGGAVLAAGFVIDALVGECIICLHNPNTGALRQSLTHFDLNLDGKIDDNDVPVKKMGKNIAIITSCSSFSCGNLVPCVLDNLDNNVLLMGQKSGGGSCEVGSITTAIGTMLQISSERKMVTMKNGYIRDIDDGVSPDTPLSLNMMYDRDHVAEIVTDYFGK